MQRIISAVLSDVMFLLAFGFAILIFIIIVWINPKGDREVDDIKPPGNLIIEIVWPENIDCDIDLWGKSPDDNTAVGYSRLRGKTLNLLRDDLGQTNDTLPLNYENMYSRGMPDGEYAFNIHNYRCKYSPVLVFWSVRIRNEFNSGATVVGTGQVITTKIGDEITLIRFTARNGEAYNVHSSPIRLRAGYSQ